MEVVQNRIKKGSKVMTAEHPGYKTLGEAGYDHATVNRIGYASGPDNVVQLRVPCGSAEMVNKRRGVSKWRLVSYVKAFQFVHCHFMEGRFMVMLAALLEPTGQQPAPAA